MEIEERRITANGIDFALRTCGDVGPLALCLHGFPDTAHTWDRLLPQLADAGFRAVAPWTRGYAPTSLSADGDYSVAALAADANALHDALGGDGDAVLVGHDWGAMTAYAAGAAGAERWRRLVALAVPPPATSAAAFFRYGQLKRSFYVFLFQTPLAEYAVGADDLAFIDGLWSDWSGGYDATDDLVHVKAALREPDNLAAAIGYYRAMFAGGGSSGLPSQPTLYLHGTSDGAFEVEGVTGAESELPDGSRVELVDGVGHFLHLEASDRVNRLVLDWLTA
jgi:pimeloyl-ACP methyl ester carboxylesterase